MSNVTPLRVSGFQEDPMRSQTMDASYYYDPEIFARERTAIFHRTWQYVGHV